MTDLTGENYPVNTDSNEFINVRFTDAKPGERQEEVYEVDKKTGKVTGRWDLEAKKYATKVIYKSVKDKD